MQDERVVLLHPQAHVQKIQALYTLVAHNGDDDDKHQNVAVC